VIPTPTAVGKVCPILPSPGTGWANRELIIGDASYYNYKDADGKEYKDIAWYVLHLLIPPPLLGTREMELMYKVLPNPNEGC
jgi:hypothetical protein